MKKLLSFLVSAVIIVGPTLSWASTDASTIQALQAQIQELQRKLKALGGYSNAGSSASEAKPSFENNSTAPSGSDSAGAGVWATGATIRAIFNDDMSNDDIIQLNNLRIQSINAQAGTALITASNDFGVKCMKYQSQNSASGISLPCPMPSSILYQIKVDPDTLLLLRNRQKATLADFMVGDRVNVYGFMDRASNAVSALIVRNIDKPAAKKFMQLNNVQVATLPDPIALPTSFVVIQNGISPCLDYGETGIGGKLFPCPMGLEMRETNVTKGMPTIQGSAGGVSGGNATEPNTYSATQNISVLVSGTATINAPSAGSAVSMYYPLVRKYSINVTADTKIIGGNRQPLTLSDIGVGDTLNIYGSQSTADGATINALVIRDLSKPIANERAVLRVAVTDASIMCMQAGNQTDGPMVTSPCGNLYNATVELYGPDGFIAKETTERGVAVFENLKRGMYTAAASAPGYERNKLADIRLEAHQIQTVAISLQPAGQGTISVRALDSLGGSVGAYYRATFEASGGTASYTWAVTDGTVPPGLGLMSPPAPMIACRIDGPCPVYPQNRILLTGTPTQSGIYKFRLTATDSQGRSGAETFLVVIRDGNSVGNLPPSIQGVTGPTVLLKGQQGTWTVKATDPENGSLSYSVVWGDESTAAGTMPSPSMMKNDAVQTSTFMHAYANLGTFTPVFTVTDNAGLSVKTSISMTVILGPISGTSVSGTAAN